MAIRIGAGSSGVYIYVLYHTQILNLTGVNRLMSKTHFPLFIIAGMPRGGTTFLYHNLNKHPWIFLPFRKEVNFFNVKYHLGVEWYNNLFNERKNDQVCGDISPPYFLDTESIRRIKAYNPGVKMIISVRDPVEYALSFYSQFHSFKFKMPCFKDFLNGYGYTKSKKTLWVKFKDNYIIDTLELFMKEFDQNVLLFDFSYLKKDSLMVLQAIERFIGVPAFFHQGNYDDEKINASDRKNVKFLSNLLHQEWLISFIHKVFPRKMTLFFRSRFDKASVQKVSTATVKRPYTDDDIKFAESELAEQRVRVKKLFEKSPLIYGLKNEIIDCNYPV